MALFIVLSILVLLSIIVISFFSSVTTELKSSQSYASGATVRHLAESATQLAISQIQGATTGENAAGLPLAWASQPGMIRTYDANGKPASYFKLYSSDSLIVDGTGYKVADDAPPADWDQREGLYTDLNSPITRDNEVFFPIIDPRAKSAAPSLSIEGFDYSDEVNGSALSGVVLAGGAADSQRLPMPVRWLYMLEDGKLVAPVKSNNGTVIFDESDPKSAPSASNPIVGRIAFWTDDDTCKINLNTASEGSFWDRPWANTATEQKYSTAIPAQNEFQRYPGHPATTSLSTVFGSLFPTATANDRKKYYDITPRVADGGTRGGTENNGTTGFINISTDSDRLYAAADEIVFSDPASRNVSAPIGKDFVEKARFFLTARSRAPEINLFGKPRMTLWPLQASSSLRNAKDKLIAFCSEIGGHSYYFQRASAYTLGGPLPSSQSPTQDWEIARNRELYNYLDALTSQSIPGFGSTFDTKYDDSRRQTLTEMFDMIRSGVNTYSPTDLIPHYNYAPRLGDPGEGQIVPLAPKSGNADNTRGFGRSVTITEAAVIFYRSNAPSTGNPPVPQPPQIRALIVLEPFTPSPGLPAWSPNVHYVITGVSNFKVGTGTSGGTPTLPFQEMFSGVIDNWVTSRVGFSGANNNFAGNTTAFNGLKACFRYAADIGQGALGKDGYKVISDNPPTSPNSKTDYPFVSAKVQLPAGATSFDFSGGDIKIQIYSGYEALPNELLQTIHMHFPPAMKLPLPEADSNPNRPYHRFGNRINATATAAAGQYIPLEYRSRLIMGGTSPTKDVVRSVEARPDGPAKGDLRIFAALSEVPASYFQPSESYDEIDAGTGLQKVRVSHSLRDGAYSSDAQFGFAAAHGGLGNNPNTDNHKTTTGVINEENMTTKTVSGFLVRKDLLSGWLENDSQKEYRLGSNPAVPKGLTEALNINGDPGDWDNMTGSIEDGPYINKPDEGNSETVTNFASLVGNPVNGLMSGGYYSRGLGRTTGFDYRAGSQVTFSPNRQVSSGVMFGSLPTGIDPINFANQRPWQTLLFCANPAAGEDHPGFGTPRQGPPYTVPPDHLMLDLFTMPIVEPYAISEPFSSAGKINMNYQIAPFTYITRNTGVRAVLKSTQLTAIPTRASTAVTNSERAYKEGSVYPYELRYEINPAENSGTLEGFADRFANDDLFRSASEICDIFLVPKRIAGKNYGFAPSPPNSYAATASWWDSFRLTGDNARETPYGSIYARLTTKSNSYTVHYKVQTLKKVPFTSKTQWIEGKDVVTGENRGSVSVERYIDAGASNLPDFAAPDAPSAEKFYKIRTVGSTSFNP